MIETTIPNLLVKTRGNQSEVARMIDCTRNTVSKFARDNNGEYHRVLIVDESIYRVLTVTKQPRI